MYKLNENIAIIGSAIPLKDIEPGIYDFKLHSEYRINRKCFNLFYLDDILVWSNKSYHGSDTAIVKIGNNNNKTFKYIQMLKDV